MQRGVRRRSRRVAGAVALALVFAPAAFAQPTLQFELMKYPYPAAPAYAEGEPRQYQQVLLRNTGPVVPGELAANWRWDLVPSGRQGESQAKLDFHVNQLLGPDLGVVRIKGTAVNDGSGSVAVYLDRYGVAFRKRDFCASTGAATAFRTPLGGFTVVWLGYFPHGMTNLGMYLIVRAKGDGTPYPACDGKGIVNADEE